MSNERAVVLCRGHVGFTIAAPCRSLMAVLLGLAVLSAVLPVAVAQGVDLPAGVFQQDSGYYYIVQKGDTLWDLSRRFADTPFYWPQLWKENEQIPNPHRIFPGDRIRLYRRAWAEPLTAPEAPKAPEAPPPPPSYHYAGIEAVGFVRSQPVAPVATVFKLAEDDTIAGRWEMVLVRPAEGTTLLPGQQFTVYRTFDPIVDKTDKGLVGYQHYLLGVVEITEASGELAKAAVIRSFREIHAGDKLMPRPDPLPDPMILLADAAPGIQAKILRAEEDLTSFGDHTVVFINRGQSDGIAVGQRYAVYEPSRQHTDPKTGEQAGVPALSLGTLLVLHTEADTATALVTRSAREIAAGALVMTPQSE
jgi:hypothetical protein